LNTHDLPIYAQPIDKRLLSYWRSLLTVKPTGNAMVDAGFHEEVRSALRDALHALQDVSRRSDKLEILIVNLMRQQEQLLTNLNRKSTSEEGSAA